MKKLWLIGALLLSFAQSIRADEPSMKLIKKFEDPQTIQQMLNYTVPGLGDCIKGFASRYSFNGRRVTSLTVWYTLGAPTAEVSFVLRGSRNPNDSTYAFFHCPIVFEY